MAESSTSSKQSPMTRFFQVPGQRFKTKEDVIKAFGYTLANKLDEGGFGTVFIADDNRKKIKVACKWMDLGAANANDSRMADTRNELMVLEQVRHPYVIKVLCHFIVQQNDNNNMYIFMELADGGNLQGYFVKRGVPNEVECAKYFAQVVCGIAHMHGLGIAHRDIKMQNVLLVANARSITGDYLLRVSDFGLSKQVKVEKEKRTVEMSESICGTPLYMAPELMQKKLYNAFSVDVWALGMTLYEMLSLELPFDFDKPDEEVLQDIMAQKWNWSSKIKDSPPSGQLDNLMKGMLNPDAGKRLRLVKVLAHEWVANDYKAAHDLSDQIKAEEAAQANSPAKPQAKVSPEQPTEQPKQ